MFYTKGEQMARDGLHPGPTPPDGFYWQDYDAETDRMAAARRAEAVHSYQGRADEYSYVSYSGSDEAPAISAVVVGAGILGALGVAYPWFGFLLLVLLALAGVFALESIRPGTLRMTFNVFRKAAGIMARSARTTASALSRIAGTTARRFAQIRRRMLARFRGRSLPAVERLPLR